MRLAADLVCSKIGRKKIGYFKLSSVATIPKRKEKWLVGVACTQKKYGRERGVKGILMDARHTIYELLKYWWKRAP